MDNEIAVGWSWSWNGITLETVLVVGMVIVVRSVGFILIGEADELLRSMRATIRNGEHSVEMVRRESS